ncbi:MAG: class I SAM-dependent methyltransferase [Chlamydiales bacterium]|nr:class I SAM-dependent methyltransferase [Chlamydiales bacterium]
MFKPCPLSKASYLWDLQYKTYSDHGPACWTKLGVPLQISSNAYTAYYFSELIKQLRPRTILEIGAGTGRFTYMLLQLLSRDIEYHMSDISEKSIIFWKANELLNKRTKMHFYNPLNDQPVCSPDLIIANYVFDAMPQALYRKQNGQLFEGIANISGGPSINELKLKWEYQPCQTHFTYSQSIDNVAFTYPTSALHLLNLFPKAAFMIADKGMWTLEQLREPTFNQHGTFSLPVNFHALVSDFCNPTPGIHFCRPQQPDPRYSVGIFSKSPLPPIKMIEPDPQSALDQFMALPSLDSLRKMHWDPMLYLMIAKHVKLTKAEKAEVDKRFYPLSVDENLVYEWS